MEGSKNILFKTISVFIVVVSIVLVYLTFLGPLERYVNSLVVSRTISVSASDKVTAVPDVANLTFSVITEGIDISQITNENNSKINQAIEMLKSNGVDSKDIETTAYSLLPVYTQPQKEGGSSFVPQIAKYSLTQSVLVKIRDFSKISSIMSALPRLGINKIGNISFDIDDREIYLSQAREKAFYKAYQKALAMAKQNGVKIGKVISISEYPQYNYPVYKEIMSSSVGGVGEEVAPNIQPGSQDVSVNVTVVYEIK